MRPAESEETLWTAARLRLFRQSDLARSHSRVLVIVVYTGPIRSGKTTALRARLAAPDALGVLAPDLDGRRHLLRLDTSEARAVESDAPADPVTVGRFVFDGAVFAWARDGIDAAIEVRPETLVIDEVGPLELAGRGLEPAVRASVEWARGTEARLVLVVRDSLLDRVIDHYAIRAHARIERHVPFTG